MLKLKLQFVFIPIQVDLLTCRGGGRRSGAHCGGVDRGGAHCGGVHHGDVHRGGVHHDWVHRGDVHRGGVREHSNRLKGMDEC